MKKINLLGAEFLARFTEVKVIKLLLILLAVFSIGVLYLSYDLQRYSQPLEKAEGLMQEVQKLEQIVQEQEEAISSKEESLQQIKRTGYFYSEIANFFGKYVPDGVIILSVYGEGDMVRVRGIAENHKNISRTIAAMQEHLPLSSIDITEIVDRDESEVFELALVPEVDLLSELRIWVVPKNIDFINTASREELQELIHIDAEIADEIIEERPFESFDDFSDQVGAIGETELEDIINQRFIFQEGGD
jgi:Tfp pilus assembly protein PilN